MKRVIIAVIICFAWGQALWAECYLEIENPGEYEPKAISQISSVHISQYFENVEEIPPSGISSDACLYRLSVTEVSNGILVTIKGPEVSAYGDSRLRGIDGFKQALFRAIISTRPQSREPICRQHRSLMESDCGEVDMSTQAAATPRGKLVVRVPREYRYAAIYGDGELIGQMSGDRVKEFEVAVGRPIRIRAEDGDYVSEPVTVTPSDEEIRRIDLTDFAPSSPEKKPLLEDDREGKIDTTDEEPVAFGEQTPFLFGFGGGSHRFSSDDDQYRRLRKEIDHAFNLEFFMEYFLTLHFGLGFQFKALSEEQDTRDPEVQERMNVAIALATVTLWFPMDHRHRGFGFNHFGLKGGVGPASYNVDLSGVDQQDERNKWETTGSASSYGAFFDWGGDGFGARLSYTVVDTDFTPLKNKVFPNDLPQYDVDASGSGWTFSVRWAF